MYSKLLGVLVVVLFPLLSSVSAQNVGINTSTPDTKAVLDISANNRGLLIPRLTTAQRTSLIANGSALDSTRAGLMVFDTDLNHFYFWSKKDKKWQSIAMNSDILPYPSINVRQFGAKGDNTNDDTGAFTAAIAAASAIGATVFVPVGVYKITSTIDLPAGVSLLGEGSGDKPLQVSTKGSLLYFYGQGLAVRISGSNASMRKIGLLNRALNHGNDGIRLDANGILLESVQLEQVVITDFLQGSALELKASNVGGIAYCSFYDIRVRNAKTGIKIGKDATSFANSCTFTGGVVSGGGFDHCLMVNGGNNHKFVGTVFEPYTSQMGHIVVNDGQILGVDIRIEGVSQPATTPLLYFAANTVGSMLTGLFSGGQIRDMGNNLIQLKSGKSLGIRPPSENLFENAAFSGNDNNIPFWKFTNVQNAIVSPPEPVAGHNVLSITVAAGTVGSLAPDPSFAPKQMTAGMYSQVNFGYFVRTAQSAAVYTTFNAPAGLTSSTAHTGDGSWQFISMNAFANPASNPIPKLVFDNSTGTQPLVVEVSVPTFSFGLEIPPVSSKPISSSGGIITGTLTMGMDTVNTVPSNGFLVLEKNGNIFEISATQTIHRINEPTAVRFPRGTVITLLFNNANVTVNNSGYINLKSTFVSSANGSLTLLSLGNGTWREMDRN